MSAGARFDPHPNLVQKPALPPPSSSLLRYLHLNLIVVCLHRLIRAWMLPLTRAEFERISPRIQEHLQHASRLAAKANHPTTPHSDPHSVKQPWAALIKPGSPIPTWKAVVRQVWDELGCGLPGSGSWVVSQAHVRAENGGMADLIQTLAKVAADQAKFGSLEELLSMLELASAIKSAVAAWRDDELKHTELLELSSDDDEADVPEAMSFKALAPPSSTSSSLLTATHPPPSPRPKSDENVLSSVSKKKPASEEVPHSNKNKTQPELASTSTNQPFIKKLKLDPPAQPNPAPHPTNFTSQLPAKSKPATSYTASTVKPSQPEVNTSHQPKLPKQKAVKRKPKASRSEAKPTTDAFLRRHRGERRALAHATDMAEGEIGRTAGQRKSRAPDRYTVGKGGIERQLKYDRPAARGLPSSASTRDNQASTDDDSDNDQEESEEDDNEAFPPGTFARLDETLFGWIPVLVLPRRQGRSSFYKDKIAGLDLAARSDSVLVANPISDGHLEWVSPTRLQALRPYPYEEDHPHELDDLVKPPAGWEQAIKDGWQRVSTEAWRKQRLALPSAAEHEAKREARREPARAARQRKREREEDEWRELMRAQRVDSEDDGSSTTEEEW